MSLTEFYLAEARGRRPQPPAPTSDSGESGVTALAYHSKAVRGLLNIGALAPFDLLAIQAIIAPSGDLSEALYWASVKGSGNSTRPS